VLLVSLCNVAAVAAATAFSASAETSGAVMAGAEMSQRREVPAPKRSAPRRWRRNGAAEMSHTAPFWFVAVYIHIKFSSVFF